MPLRCLGSLVKAMIVGISRLRKGLGIKIERAHKEGERQKKKYGTFSIANARNVSVSGFC